MDLSLPFLFALWAFGGSSAPAPAPTGPTRRRGPRARRMPTSRPTPAAPAALPSAAPPPWPQAVPASLPPFPGSGWEFDEPPPKAVQTRAGQLLSQLWARGEGTHKTEQTEGRWITYRASITAGGKHGVVAYRLKAAAPAGASTATTATQVTRRPDGKKVMVLKAGHFYGVTFSTERLPDEQAAELRAHVLSRYPQWQVLDSRLSQTSAATSLLLSVRMLKDQQVTIGAVANMLGHGVQLTGVIQQAGGASSTQPVKVSTRIPAPGGVVTAKSPLELPTLRYGMGLKPQPPDENVKLAQGKLGIAADGRFGSGTRTAVRAFQGRKGLLADGVVGPKTWAALFGTTWA